VGHRKRWHAKAKETTGIWFPNDRIFFFGTTAKAAVGSSMHQMQWREQSFSKTNNLTTYISHGLEFVEPYIYRPIPRTCSTLMLLRRIYVSVLWLTPDILFTNCRAFKFMTDCTSVITLRMRCDTHIYIYIYIYIYICIYICISGDRYKFTHQVTWHNSCVTCVTKCQRQFSCH